MIDENELNIFVESVIKAYKNTSILKKISNVIDYSDKYSTKEFIQIGHRTPIPKEFFFVGNKFDNRILAGDFARSVVWGEENFLIEYLTGLAKENRIALHKMTEFSYEKIVEIIVGSSANNLPTDIFVPIDQLYYNKIHDWIYEKKAEYSEDGLCISVGNKKIKVHWSSKYTPFKDIIFINNNSIRIIQKKFEDMAPIKGLDDPIYSYNKGEPLRVEFRESNEHDKFDLYLRSVITVNIIDEDSVGVIELPKTITLSLIHI